MDAVCFDMDGVLVDSEDYWISRQREVILPAACPDDDVPVEAATGVYYREQYDVLAADYDVAVSRAELEAMYEDAAEEIYRDLVTLTDGVPDLLDALRDEGVRLAMVTSSPPEWHDIVLDRFDLADRFEAVVCAADLDAPGKPEPHVYERAANELDVDPADCVAVEDSRNGIESARRAGMATVGFGVGDAGEHVTDADDAAETPAELRDLLLERV